MPGVALDTNKGAEANTPGCSVLLPLWSSFVDAFVNSCQAQGPSLTAAPPPLHPSAASSSHYLPPVPRLVAVGDLHGDVDKTLQAFRLAGLVDARGRWIGGTTTVVQVGDQLDRGGNELAILHFLERVAAEAREAGGALHTINGNHETLNVAARYRYATSDGARDFQRWHLLQLIGQRMKERCGQPAGCCAVPPSALCPEGLHPQWCARYLALAPGGPVTRRFLADQKVILQVGKTVFAHGGVLPEHVDYGVDRINAETSAWMHGENGTAASFAAGATFASHMGMPRHLGDSRSVVWTRDYSDNRTERNKCETLAAVLKAMPHPATRMVMGHTIQRAGINHVCGGQALRVDVGMSKGCRDGAPEVLEILQDSQVYRLMTDASGKVVRVPVPQNQ